MDKTRWSTIIREVLAQANLGDLDALHAYASNQSSATPQQIAAEYIRDHGPRPIKAKA